MDFNEFSDNEFAAYLAGFTDGEGNISSHMKYGGVRITLANCVQEVLEAMRKRFGYGVIRSQQQKPHWRRRYVLVFDDAFECEAFTKVVYPYLKIKKNDADKLLARCQEWNNIIEEFNDRNRKIREAISSGEKQNDIAARFGISPQTVSRIKLGHNWPSEKPKNVRGLQGKVMVHRNSHKPL